MSDMRSHLAGALLAIVAAATTPAHAAAADWQFVTRVPEPRLSDIYIDTRSLASSAGGYKDAWVRTEFAQAKSFRRMHAYSSLEKVAVDCRRRKLGTSERILYSRRSLQGDVVDTWKTRGDLENVAPETVGEAILEAICAVR